MNHLESFCNFNPIYEEKNPIKKFLGGLIKTAVKEVPEIVPKITPMIAKNLKNLHIDDVLKAIDERIVVRKMDRGCYSVNNSNVGNAGAGLDVDLRHLFLDQHVSRYGYGSVDDAVLAKINQSLGNYKIKRVIGKPMRDGDASIIVTEIEKDGKPFLFCEVFNSKTADPQRDGRIYLTIANDGTLPDNIDVILKKKAIDLFDKEIQKGAQTFKSLPTSLRNSVENEYKTKVLSKTTSPNLPKESPKPSTSSVSNQLLNSANLSKYKYFINSRPGVSKTEGPFSYDEILKKIKNGQLSGDVSIWREGVGQKTQVGSGSSFIKPDDYIKVKDLNEFRSLFGQVKPASSTAVKSAIAEAPKTTLKSQYWLYREGYPKSYGPYSITDLIYYAKEGKILGTDKLNLNGTNNWMNAKDLQELKNILK